MTIALVGTGTVTNASTASPSFGLPVGVAAGDLIILPPRVAGGASVTTPPSGYTLVGSHTTGDGTLYLYARVAGASETNPSLTLSAAATVYGAATVIRGAHLTIADIIAAFDGVTTSSAPVVPAITTAADASWALAVVTCHSGTPSYSTIGGYTVLWSQASPEARAQYQAVPAAGTTVGPHTVSAGTNRGWIAAHLAIRPAATGGGPTTYTRTLAGVLAPAGAPTKQSRTRLAGVLSSTGGAAKRLRTRLVGGIAGAGSLLKHAHTRLAGSLAPAGAVARRTRRALIGMLSPGAVLATRTVRIVRLALARSLALAGSLGRAAYTRRAGVVAPAAALRKQPRKHLPGAVSLGANIRKRARRRLASALNLAGALLGRVVAPSVVTYPPVGAVHIDSGAITCVAVAGCPDLAVASGALSVEVE